MSRPPRSPYPPDPADDAPSEAIFGELIEVVSKDALFERCELSEATFSAVSLQRVELRGCDLTGLRGAESLRGARMPWGDVLENATLFASVLGLEIVG